MTDFDLSLPPLEEVRAQYASMRIAPGRVVMVEHEALDRAARSKLGILAPVMYRVRGDKQDYDRLFMGRVVRCGAHRIERGKIEPIGVKQNDIALASLFNVGHRFTWGRVKHYRFDARTIAGTLDPETLAVRPSGAYVVVEPAEEQAQQSINPGGQIWLPDTERGQTDDIENDQGIKAEYGRVIQLGSGTWLDGELVDPSHYCQVGDVVLYDKSFHTLPLRIGGRSVTLVECRQIIMAERQQEEAECQERSQKPSEERGSAFRQSSFPPPAGLRSAQSQ